MRRKYKYYVGDRTCYAKDFWRVLKTYYLKAESMYPSMAIIIDTEKYNEVVYAIKHGAVITPMGSYYAFRREEVYA